jgi:hypothetical protein
VLCTCAVWGTFLLTWARGTDKAECTQALQHKHKHKHYSTSTAVQAQAQAQALQHKNLNKNPKIIRENLHKGSTTRTQLGDKHVHTNICQLFYRLNNMQRKRWLWWSCDRCTWIYIALQNSACDNHLTMVHVIIMWLNNACGNHVTIDLLRHCDRKVRMDRWIVTVIIIQQYINA